MLDPSMLPARLLDRILRLLLALTLGLGPVGVSVLAASLHASVCGCAGCGSEVAAEGCCLPDGPEEPASTRLAAEEGCPCSLARPASETLPAPAARLCTARDLAGSGLSVGPRALEHASGWFAVRPAPSERVPSGCASPPGPPGTRRAHGAARAAALGPQLL